MINKENYWITNLDSQKTVVWKGLAFENVCINHINQIKNALGISGVASNNYVWSKKASDDSDGAQIDLIIDRNDNIINLCEIKFYKDYFKIDKDYHFKIIRKENVLKENIKRKTVSIRSTLVTTFGVYDNEYRFDFNNIITLDDLFE